MEKEIRRILINGIWYPIKRCLLKSPPQFIFFPEDIPIFYSDVAGHYWYTKKENRLTICRRRSLANLFRATTKIQIQKERRGFIIMKPTMIMMCGLPKSGKSTYIKKMLSGSIETRPDVIISSDEIRKQMFGHEYFPTIEGIVWTFAYGMAQLLLAQNLDIIVDSINIHVYSRAKWITIARKYQAEVRIVYMTTDAEECVKRNKGSIPDIEITKRTSYFTYPEYEEGFDDIYSCDGTDIELVPKPKVYIPDGGTYKVYISGRLVRVAVCKEEVLDILGHIPLGATYEVRDENDEGIDEFIPF